MTGAAVEMRCADLGPVPDVGTPPTFSLRWYQPGDEKHWVAIHQDADRYNVTNVEVFKEQFGDAWEELPSRQCYLLDSNGCPVGTATAWHGRLEEGKLAGRVHWVAIRTEHQGRGLAKPLMTAVCQRMLELGFSEAYLTTDIRRVPAINLYWSFGFAPTINAEEDAQAWRRFAASDGPDRRINPDLLAHLHQALSD